MPFNLRSPSLLSRGDSALLVIDVQEKLAPAIDDCKYMVSRCILIARAATLLSVPILVTEQYPKGLGTTVADLAPWATSAISKTAFSAATTAILEELGKKNIAKVLLAGIECHVCVQQTALDLLAAGFRVYLAVDAVGSRRPMDKHWALERMSQNGVTMTTAEAVVFEWTENADAPEFKEISKLIKEMG